MRRSLAATLVALVTVLGLALTLAPAVVSAADEGKARATVPLASLARTAATTDSERASAALARAKALFGGPRSGDSRNGAPGGKSGKHADATLVMRDLFTSLDDLSPADRKVAHGILARPTDGASDPYSDGYLVPSEKKCKGNFCMHWVTTTEDAPPSQTWVNQMLTLMNKVWKKEVKKYGYRPPVSDGNRGGNGKFDVYLAQIGDAGLYGYCAPERRKPGYQWLASGYCVLDNDFAEFPLAPMDSAEVTAAHEFFHAIQFGYDFGEDVWMLEATATWMEEHVFDEVNDNRQYLPAGQVFDPTFPLDYFNPSGSQQYGNWPFFEFLSKNYGVGVVKAIWNKAAAFRGAPDHYSTQAISSVLKPKGGFAKNYSRFASANLLPGKFYPEGASWPSAQLKGVYTLTKAHRQTGKHGTHTLHMTSASWRVKSSSSLRSSKWHLKVKIDGPAAYRMPAAYVLVAKRKGFDKIFVKLNGKGNGQVVVPFGRKKVKAVYISLVNASTRFKCGKKYAFSCQGLPIDDGRSFKGQPYKFSASVIKR
jgi:hypothetical protein